MFYERLVTLCAEKGTNPTALCDALGLSQSAATRWKQGSVPRDTTLNKIAKYFGVTPEYLLGIKSIDLQHFAEPTSVDVAVEKFAASIQDAVRAAEEKKPPSMLERLADVVKSLPKDDLEELGRYADYLASRKNH
jgi:transcriptional regulator with XRE-family HTH domain